ncbi:MAG: hypothetical protein HIU91_06730 [Acidobacteria bacterium]|nr:hypothetical protein [Acidobacteriota bacterium]
MEVWRRALLGVFLLGLAAGVGLRAQGPGVNQDSGLPTGGFAGMARVGGEVTAVDGSALTVKTGEGSVMHIITTDNTRVMKGRGVTVKVSDLKVGDGVMAAGILDAPNKTLHAAVLFATDAAQLKAMRDNLGKTYIVGRVKAIDMDNAKMTVERPDGVAQTIGFDETTSFRRGKRDAGSGLGAGGAALPETGESITLADVKTGDGVRGKGSIKGGLFVPTELVVVAPREGSARRSATTGDAHAGATMNAPH